MADPAASYQSLYRRYRPQRFGEVLGQDHVTKALRNAVRDGRVGHAYLFSGPRGTGKTSTARILAKALNCDAPVDGEPDCQCDNCVSVERGLVVDWLLEQDAASKSKVDDMRDLLDRVPLGTSGKRKVIILDEVHMLSQGAENALLKTLEEPPDHVVFVLATTDPQKVRPTIRSRTQHFTFHLLPPALLTEHMRHVIADAGIPLSDVDDAVAHVVRSGGGSARDTLSALDQVAALGEVVADSQPVEAILDALAARDAGAALVAVAEAAATGRDSRALGEAVIVRLRDAFLALMGVPDAQDERARALGEQLGAAGLTRALDVLGEALTELSRKPDPRVVLEVALVRLVRPDADQDLAAVLDRLERLEHAVRTGAVPGPGDGPTGGSAPTASTSPPGSPSTPGDASSPGPGGGGGGSNAGAAPAPARPADEPSARGSAPNPAPGDDGPASAARAALAAKLGESKRGGGAKPRPKGGQAAAATDTAPAATATAPSDATNAKDDAPTPTPAGGESSATATATSTAAAASPSQQAKPATEAPPAPAPADGKPAEPTAAGAPDLATLSSKWTEQVLGELPLPVRSKWRGGSWVAVADGRAQFATPNEWHKKACDEGRSAVEQALRTHFGTPVAVEVVVSESGADGPPGGAPTPGRSPSSSSASGAPGGAGEPDDADDMLSPDEVRELKDAGDVATGGVDLLLREFGGELVEEDPK